MHDVFICHASEDKDDFVRPLAERLRQQHINVWYDEFSLSIGDSLTQKIDEGLARSRFGVVVLSPNFFKKPWAKRELNGLTMREMIEQRNLILPVWHRVSVQDVAQFSLPLADKKAASSAEGINAITRELTKKIKPDDSPLIVARDYLFNLKVNTPPITDEWWLDIVEYKESLKYPDINMGSRWIFPLPHSKEDRGRERGINIASAALQSDWSFEGDELNIGPTTRPEEVHSFIQRWPGLYDCTRSNPAMLALYAPQLTIPGFDSGFKDVFDELLQKDSKGTDMIFSYGRHSTIDDKDPLCADIIALRHPNFGNYTPEELGHWYFTAHDGYYLRSHWNVCEGLVWLNSDDSTWLPENYRETFIRGILKRIQWVNDVNRFDNPFIEALYSKTRSQFSLTKTIKAGLQNLVESAIKSLEIDSSSEEIMKRLLELDIAKCYYDYQDWLKEMRSKKN